MCEHDEGDGEKWKRRRPKRFLYCELKLGMIKEVRIRYAEGELKQEDIKMTAMSWLWLLPSLLSSC